MRAGATAGEGAAAGQRGGGGLSQAMAAHRPRSRNRPPISGPLTNADAPTATSATSRMDRRDMAGERGGRGRWGGEKGGGRQGVFFSSQPLVAAFFFRRPPCPTPSVVTTARPRPRQSGHGGRAADRAAQTRPPSTGGGACRCRGEAEAANRNANVFFCLRGPAARTPPPPGPPGIIPKLGRPRRGGSGAAAGGRAGRAVVCPFRRAVEERRAPRRTRPAPPFDPPLVATRGHTSQPLWPCCAARITGSPVGNG